MDNFSGMYDIRDAKIEDANFVLATFLRGLYYGESWYSAIPKDIFMSNYKRIAVAMLANPNNIVKIACLKEDPDVILGYSILSSDYQVIHWVFVKKVWRKKGIARSLVPSRPQFISHLTNLGKDLLSKFPKETVYNPFTIG